MPKFGTEEDLHKILDSIDEESLSARGDFNRRIKENLDQFRGDQWKLPGRSPNFLLNMIEKSIEDKVGKLSESRPMIRVLPMREGLEDPADVLRKSINSIWDRRKIEYKSERIGLFGAIMGVAFVATPFNLALSHGLGDIDFIVKDPRQCRVDPSVTAAEDSNMGEYVILEEPIPLDIIRSTYAPYGGDVKPDERLSSFDDRESSGTSIKSVLARLIRGKPGKKSSAIPMALVKEYYIQDRRSSINDLGILPLIKGKTKWAEGGIPFPGGRRVIRAGRVLLHDQFNPYWDGGWPIDILSWKTDLESIWGPDEVQGVKRMQESLNRGGDAYAKNLYINSVVRAIAEHNAISPKQQNELSNQIGQIINVRPGRKFDIMVPAPLPSDALLWIDKMVQFIRMKMGVQESPALQKLPSIVTGPALEGLQLMIETPIRSAARKFEEFYQRIGQKYISRIFQYYTCTDSETECLTKRGWLRYDKLTLDDEIYTLNTETEKGEWSPVLKLNVHDYIGPMYKMNGRKIDALVTPNHRWWVKGSKSCSGRLPTTSNLRSVETINLKKWHVFPSGAPSALVRNNILDPYVELIGWLVTEGHYSFDKRLKEKANWYSSVWISQSEKVNLKNCIDIRKCLKANGIQWTERLDRKVGVRTFGFAGSKAKEIIAQFPDKRLNWDFIFSLTLSQLRLLHDVMIKGDGTKQLRTGNRRTRNTVFYSADSILLEQFQTIATLCGYSTRSAIQPRSISRLVVNSDNHKSERYSDVCFVRSSEGIERPGITWNRLCDRTEIIFYNGKVWCPTTRNGTWIARRNGRVYITGNSDRILALVGPSKEWIGFEFKRAQLLRNKKGNPRTQEDIRKAYQDFYFVVDPGSSLALTKVQRSLMKFQLFQQGLVPGSDILEELEIQNPKEKMLEAQQEREQFGFGTEEEDGRKKKSGDNILKSVSGMGS